MKRLFLYMLLLCSGYALAIAAPADWRKTGSDQEKLNNVVKVIPGASNIMLQMGERYKNMYWAGKQGKWQFAEYQIEEIQELIETLIITRPKRAATAKHFLHTAFDKFPAAIQSKNWSQFSTAFDAMRGQCMRCHVQNDHAYIVCANPGKGNSPVLN